jgi:NAD(P)-dependent dehydrogenase (short-subunit alcohol dehydrogenase family)
MADSSTSPLNSNTDLASYSQLFNLSGHQIMIIGAGSGIGAAAAHGLAAFGAQVLCTDISQDAADAVAASITEQGGKAQSQAVNITDKASIEAAMDGLGQLDGLVCTPSINVRKPMLELTPDEFDKVIGINLKGSFLAMQAAGARMKAQQSGSIVLFSSIRSQVVEPGQSIYAATKAGTLQMVRGLASELGELGVRVNAIAPGVVETPLTNPIRDQPDWYNAYAQKGALGRWAQPREMVGAVVYLMSEASSFVTGTLMLVDGGWTAVDGRFTPPL